jgi:hypothetical protein
MEFLGYRRAAEDAAALENTHGEAGFGQVTGAGQAVVATAHDYRIEAVFDA